MCFDMDFAETGCGGSFEATGLGLKYFYNAPQSVLDILPRRHIEPIFFIGLNGYFPCDPRMVVRFVEKSTQISALIYSDHYTLDITETIDQSRLPALLKNAIETAGMANDLYTGNFPRFALHFMRRFDLGLIEVLPLNHKNAEKKLFRSRIVTARGSQVSVIGSHIPNLLLELSEKIVKDVITQEYCDNMKRSAHTLLNVTSMLGTLARILDNSFVPKDKVESNYINENQYVNTTS